MAWPGDEHMEAYQFLAIEVDSGRIERADYPACPLFYPAILGFFTGRNGWWSHDSRRAYFLELEQDHKMARLIEFDTHTGKTRQLVEETSDSSVTLTPDSHLAPLLMPLLDSNELIWYSERSGWAHLYLYDLDTGQRKNPITQGSWLVRNILHYDAQRRELFIQTAGRVNHRNPYYSDICRVNIDTGQLTPLLSTDHDYMVCDQFSRESYSDPTARGVSPNGRYVVTSRSRVDDVPVTVLLDRDGKKILTLETADISGLPDNWQWPESVQLKAADGKTDIYGLVFRPSDFSPDKSYPVLDLSSSFLMPTGAFTNNLGGSMYYLPPMAYAELGFIVVMISGRGTGNGLRDAAFATSDKGFSARYTQEDSIAGIKQLAQRFPYMDINRVGVGSFGANSAPLTGLLDHPDFYRVGVSASPFGNGCLFAAMKPNPECVPIDIKAKHLKGKLLLIHGMMDDVMPVAITFRLVEALQKANKRFDMLVMPNLNLDSTGYTILRAWDYFVQHLLGAEPPEAFKLTLGRELMLEAIRQRAEEAEQ